MSGTLGIIAGGGELPRAIAASARSAQRSKNTCELLIRPGPCVARTSGAPAGAGSIWTQQTGPKNPTESFFTQ